MSVQPLRDFVVVSKNDGPQTTASGLYIAHVEDKMIRGKVLAVGSGRVAADGTVIPLEVKVGDTVVFNKNLATEVTNEGETVLILREEQILCKV